MNTSKKNKKAAKTGKRKKSPQPVKVLLAETKARSVYVPANARVFIIKEGEPYPEEFRELIDKIVKNELDVIAEKDRTMKAFAAVPGPSEVFQKAGGMIFALPPDAQNAVLTQLLAHLKNERESTLMSTEHQYLHIGEQRERARKQVFDLENIMRGDVTVVRV